MSSIDTYTVHRINENGRLSHKEHLNDKAEMLDWVSLAYGRFSSIRVANDQTGEVREFTDNGEAWVRVV